MPVVRFANLPAPRKHQRFTPYTPSIATPNPSASRPSQKLPDSVKVQISEALDGSWSKSTRPRNKAVVKEFIQYAVSLDIPEDEVFPASEELLCGYAASFMGRRAGSTVRGKISVIKGRHEVLGVPYMGGAKLRRVLKGVEKAAPASSHQAKRPPVTLRMLVFLVKVLDPKIPLHAAVLAIAFIAFFAQVRLGELLPASSRLEDFDPAFHPTVSCLGKAATANGSHNLHLPWTKTEQEKGEDVFISRQEGAVDPVHATKRTILVNRLEPYHPLASFIDDEGIRRVLTKDMFMTTCNKVWEAYGQHTAFNDSQVIHSVLEAPPISLSQVYLHQ